MVVLQNGYFFLRLHVSCENHCSDHNEKQELIIQQLVLFSKQRLYIHKLWQTDRAICMLMLEPGGGGGATSHTFS